MPDNNHWFQPLFFATKVLRFVLSLRLNTFMRVSHYICTLFAMAVTILFLSGPALGETLERDRSASKVRDIIVEVREVFDEPDIGAIYQGVNAIKMSTREEVIRRELLFQEGDSIDEFIVRESERNLRALNFVRQVSVTPVQVVGQADIVDVLVSVQDTWTLFPVFSFDIGGGADKMAAGVLEKNLGGYGKRIELLYADDEGRETIEGVWDDKRLFGTYHRLLVGHFVRSDGYRSIEYFGRPFRSLVDKSSWGVATQFSDTVDRLFEGGDERFIFRQKTVAARGGYTIATGDPEEKLGRYMIGYGYSDRRFNEADADDFEDADVDPDSVIRDPELVPEDRRFSGPILSFELIEPEYISINYVDRFDRVEDFSVGREINGGVQYAADVLGSYGDSALFFANFNDGARVSPTSFYRYGLGMTSRYDDDGLENSIGRLDLKYYNVVGRTEFFGMYVGRHTLAGSMTVTLGEDLDKDVEFLLGADSGLRGYDDRTFTGDYAFLLNLEDRIHFREDIYRLFSLGAAAFIDIGGASREALGDVFTSELRTTIGVGLRIGLPRSSGGSVVRIDVATPLREGPDGSKPGDVQLLFTTGQAFSPSLRTESFTTQGADATVNAIR